MMLIFDKVSAAICPEKIFYFHFDKLFAKYAMPHDRSFFGEKSFFFEGKEHKTFDYCFLEPCMQGGI